jgi:hypothetical protein
MPNAIEELPTATDVGIFCLGLFVLVWSEAEWAQIGLLDSVAIR